MKKNSKKIYQNYKDKIIDMVLFGSHTKGKSDPSDIDISIILKNTKENELKSIREKINNYFDEDIHLNFLIIETILENPLFKTLIEEGISLIDNKSLHQKIGYESGAIFSIKLTKLRKSKKVLFSYALHGHKEKEGMIKKTNSREIGRSVIYVPISFISEFKEFLELWKVDFYMIKILKG